ncbi:hypothetical protein CL634_02685 [bacterium]|nr:hypothetical protein [bacterium]|tara:strand:- start:182 stop:724 length:543 start_codon:yes stop_codon:yes gene_type:complete
MLKNKEITLTQLIHAVLDTGTFGKTMSVMYDEYYDINNSFVHDEHKVEDVEWKYSCVVEELLSLTPDDTSIKDYMIQVRKKEDDLDPEEIIEYIDVCLYNESEDKTYAIDMTAWPELLNMRIEDCSSLDFREVLAHILYEITFYGYTSATVEEKREEILELAGRIDRGEEKLIPWDDLPF